MATKKTIGQEETVAAEMVKLTLEFPGIPRFGRSVLLLRGKQYVAEVGRILELPAADVAEAKRLCPQLKEIK